MRTDDAAAAQRRAEATAAAIRAEAEARLEREMALPDPVAQPTYTSLAQQDPAVTIERIEVQPTDYAHVADPIHEIESTPAPRYEAPVERRPYIPPQAESPTQTRPASRIPRIEEFPAIAQRQIATPQAPAEAHHDDERRPMSLLKRLASGFRRDDHDNEHTQQTHTTHAQPREPQFRQEPRERPSISAPRMQPDTAIRAQSGQLDPHGRQPVMRPQSAAPQARPSDDDQLEIPAFLRRQAN
jgi:cell division protein FtsZ